MDKKKSIYFSLGKTGMRLTLKNQSLRKGKTSIVEPGHEMVITLSGQVKIGSKISQIVEMEEVEGNDPVKKKEFVTSKVEGMTSLADGISFKIKTETSNYLAVFILDK